MTNVAQTALAVVPKTTALAPKSTTTALATVAQTASKAGGYGKLAAALVGLGVLGAATYLYSQKDGGTEKAN